MKRAMKLIRVSGNDTFSQYLSNLYIVDQQAGKFWHDAFTVIGKLGEGTSGKVDIVKVVKLDAMWHYVYSQAYARKNIQLCLKCSPENLPEIEILRRLDHAHIIKLVSYYTFRDRAWFLMSPVASSDLAAFLRHRLDLILLRYLRLWFSCLSSALEYLHDQDIIHGDIKPRNILVYSSNHVSRSILLSDFGSARRVNETTNTCQHSGLTPKYGAPELHHETSTGQWWSHPLGKSADVFSLGCVFLEMATVISGRSVKSFEVFRSKGIRSASFYETLPNAMRWIDDIRDSDHQECQHLDNYLNTIKDMLNPDPWRRPTAKDVAKRFPRCTCKPDNELNLESHRDFVPIAPVELKALNRGEGREENNLRLNARGDTVSAIGQITIAQGFNELFLYSFIRRNEGWILALSLQTCNAYSDAGASPLPAHYRSEMGNRQMSVPASSLDDLVKKILRSYQNPPLSSGEAKKSSKTPPLPGANLLDHLTHRDHVCPISYRSLLPMLTMRTRYS